MHDSDRPVIVMVSGTPNSQGHVSSFPATHHTSESSLLMRENPLIVMSRVGRFFPFLANLHRQSLIAVSDVDVVFVDFELGPFTKWR
jgi:hypothetical protein